MVKYTLYCLFFSLIIGIYLGVPGGVKAINYTVYTGGLFKSINPNGNSNPTNFKTFNNKIYFSANDGSHGVELWMSDGTAIGTTLFKDLNIGASGSSPSQLTVTSNHLYFVASDGAAGDKLWVSDGTSNGTHSVAGLNPKTGTSFYSLTALNDELFFTFIDTNNHNRLWVTDGTESGTKMVSDAIDGSTFADFVVAYNNKIYFRSDGIGYNLSIWFTDGTHEGTQPIKAGGVQNAGNLAVANGLLYFSAYDPVHENELWTSDGTDVGTTMFMDLNPDGSSSPGGFLGVQDRVYFYATTTTSGYELWVTYGQPDYTRMVLDINPGANSSYPNYFVSPEQEMALFLADDGNGQSIWMTDGMSDGTIKLTMQNRALSPEYPSGIFTNYKTILFFRAYSTADSSYVLWSSYGRAQSARLVTDDSYNSIKAADDSMGVLGDYLYFSAYDQNNDVELWSLPVSTAAEVSPTVTPEPSVTEAPPTNPEPSPTETPQTINITNCQGLQNMKNHLTYNYVISNNFSCSDFTGFQPVGLSDDTGDHFFSGSLDGQGHTIADLKISSASDRVGLFGLISGSVSDIQLDNISVEGPNQVGGLAGYAVGATFSSVIVSGEIVGTRSVGGMIGLSESSTVNKSSAKGKVTGDDMTGGLVGTGNDCTIAQSFTINQVTGGVTSGGFIGRAINCHIEDSYSQSEVTASDIIVGGFAGEVSNESKKTIRNCYSSGEVVGQEYVGGFIGAVSYDAIHNSFSVGNHDFLGGNKDATLDNVYSLANGSVFFDYAHRVYTDWDFADVWDTIFNGTKYPILRWQKLSPEASPTPETTASTPAMTINAQSPSAPICTDNKPQSVPNLFQIDTTATTTKLFFTPLSNTNNYYISFSEKPNAEEHGLMVTLAREGVQNFTLNFLKPNTVYYFKVRGQSGCMPGDWSKILFAKTTIGKTSAKYYPNSKITPTKTVTSKFRTAPVIVITPTAKPTLTSLPITTPSPSPPPLQKKFCWWKWCW